MADLIFHGQFIDADNLDGETGLTVTIDVYRTTISDGSTSQVVTDGSCTETGGGIYRYRYASADLSLYHYVANMKTASTDVAQKHVAALGLVVPDALVSSRLAPTDAGRTLDIAATGEASANVTKQAGVAVAAADANGNVPVVLYPTQGAVTFGQVKILASVANEGALDIVNSAAGGIGQRNVGSDTNNGAGQRNVGFVGQLNDGSAIGQENNCELHGNYSTYGLYNVGPTAQYNEGTTVNGVGLKLGGGRNSVYMESSSAQPVVDIQSYGNNEAAVRVLQYSAAGDAVSLSADAGDGLKVSGAGAGNVGIRIVGGVDPDFALEATAQAILEDTGTTLPAAIEAIEPGGGSYAGDGTGYYTDTIDDGTNPLDGVRVQLYTAPNRVGPAYEAYTNALGVFEMWPDPGVYYRWLDLAGYNFLQDVAVTVTEP